MISISKATQATTGLLRARVFRTITTTPRRPLTSLTMGFAEIAAWKARCAAAAATSPNGTAPATSPPTTTTMLHSAIASPPFPRRLLAPEEPSNPNERSASEILDVPSLHVLGKLHAGSRNSGPAPLPAPAPAPAAPASDKPSKSNKTVPKSTLASGLETLRRLGETLSGWGKNGGGTSGGSSTSGATTAPMVGGVPLDGGVAAEKGEKQGKKLEFQRELPMFLGGGLY